MEFIVGLVLAIITYLPVAGFVFFLSALGVDFGRTTMIMLALLLGYPVGSLLGILLVDRFFFKAKGWNAFGIGLSITLGVMGGLGGLMMISRLGDYSLVIIPALIACLAVVGYNLGSLFKRN